MQTLRYIALLSIISLGGMAAATAQTSDQAAPKADKAAAVKIDTHTAAAAAVPRAAAAQPGLVAKASKAAFTPGTTHLAMLTPAKATGPKPVSAALGKSTAVRHGAVSASARISKADKSDNAAPKAASRLRGGTASANVRVASLATRHTAAAPSHMQLIATPQKATPQRARGR